MKREELKIQVRKILVDYHRRNDYPLDKAENDILKLISEEPLPDKKEECEWEEEENFEYFATQCGEAYCLIDGTIEENNHKYCPFCGKKIQLKKGQ